MARPAPASQASPSAGGRFPPVSAAQGAVASGPLISGRSEAGLSTSIRPPMAGDGGQTSDAPKPPASPASQAQADPAPSPEPAPRPADLTPEKIEAELEGLYTELCANLPLTSDCNDLKAMVEERIRQNQSTEPVLAQDKGGARDILLAHVANAALKVIEGEDVYVGHGQLGPHGTDIYKLYKEALYRLKESDLISNDNFRQLMQVAYSRITAH